MLSTSYMGGWQICILCNFNMAAILLFLHASCTFFNSFEISSSFSFNLSFSIFNFQCLDSFLSHFHYFLLEIYIFLCSIKELSKLRPIHTDTCAPLESKIRRNLARGYAIYWLPGRNNFVDLDWANSNFAKLDFPRFGGCFVVTRDSTDLTVSETRIDWYKHTIYN